MLIQKILIANRGEIALRIMRTCHELGIGTVAVYSEADREAPFVRFADEALCIGPAPSRESYLAGAKLIDAAFKTRADAIHPGYGFLSENADFAEAVRAAGIGFIGPTPDSMRKMGKKSEARQLVAAHGVPVVPGYDGPEQRPEFLRETGLKIGFPLLVKASAGGGGKGMRIVRRADELEAALASAKREAESAFGDGTLLLERYIENPRHIEFQILGDQHGTLIHLFERECSIQRRHQKIIEETPSPALTPALREKMGQAAVAVGRAIAYQNAGTVEFILAPDGAFYFLEVNTRLQVEHPVTEAVTGLDLVREQIRIAEGHPLRLEPKQVGSAIEVRLYAEDPANNFLPVSGTLERFVPPAGLRVDAGVESGSEISIFYDPMIAKIIAHGPTREDAIRRLRRGLTELEVAGVTTNRELLLAILSRPEFIAGEIDTHFIERHHGVLFAAPAPEELARRRRVAAFAALLADQRASPPILPSIRRNFRNNPVADPWLELAIDGVPLRLEYRRLDPKCYHVTADGFSGELLALHVTEDQVVFELEGVRQVAHLSARGPAWYVHTRDGAQYVERLPRFRTERSEEVTGACLAPMPGKVVLVRVAAGASVERGQQLLVLEAMKMEHSVLAPHAGTVERLLVDAGDQVAADALLVVVTPAVTDAG